MEDNVFPSEAVASLMKQHLIEARLHTDTQNTLTDAQFARNRELQSRIAGTRANPYFVLVDPKTGAKVSEFKLSGGFTTWEQKWIDWIESSARQQGRLVD